MLPFLVLVWAAKLSGGFWSRLVRAGVPSVAVFGVVFGGATWLTGSGWAGCPRSAPPR